jgi:DNA-binding NtrC family response regulator
MNILVLEDEIYLAQKVVSRLLEEGHSCEHFISLEEVNLEKEYDTILLSTNLSNDTCNTILKRYSSSDILLLVSYISETTVTNPIKSGASDYVLKPFIMDELIRKIEHFNYFRQQEAKIQMYEQYFEFVFGDLDIAKKSITLPLLVETPNKDYVYKVLFSLVQLKRDKDIKFYSLKDMPIEQLDLNDDTLYLLTDYHLLKKNGKEQLNHMLKGKDVILQSRENEELFAFEKLVFESTSGISNTDNIMSINDYVKLMILNFQAQYPDTELSKRLGISRKSLWEKRKKFGIEKKK